MLPIWILFSGWYRVSVQQLGQLCCNDGVGLFAIGTARLKLQHLQAMTVTLMTQHKPIEKSTGMAFMIEKIKFKLGWTVFTQKCSMGSAWLQSMFMQGGVPASRHPWWYNATQSCTTLAQRTIYRSRYSVSQSKPDLVAHNSGSCRSVCFSCSCSCFSGKDQRPLDWWFFCYSDCGYFVNQFANPFALNTVFLCVFLKTGSVYPKISFCQNIILP